MIRNYFKIGWRNIIKSPFYSLVNIAGLSVGIAFTMLILAYIWSELRVNSDLRNKDRQFIIRSSWKEKNQGYDLATLGPLAKALKENYPRLVTNYYRYDGITTNISKNGKSFREGVQIGDSTMLSMFGFRLAQGDARTALNEPYAVVITKAAATKYFGKQDAIGQTLTIDNFSGSRQDFKVTGVLGSAFKNSITHLVEDFPNQFFVSDKNLAFFGRNMNWDNASIANFVELQAGVKPGDLDKPIHDLVKSNAPVFISENVKPYLTSLDEYYLVANNGLVRKLLYALGAIALFTLFMAVINFVNLAVSRSATRMKEIGIRKTLGGRKGQLIGQFLVESILLVFLATLLALLIYILSRSIFGSIMSKPIPLLADLPLTVILLLLGMILFIGLLAGIYPAFVLSALKTNDSLKGKLGTVKEKVWLRKGLVAFQFSTATVVFAAALIISQQIRLFFSEDLGYNKDYMVSAQVPRDWSLEGVAKMAAIRNQFAAMPEVSAVTLSFEVPDGNNSGSFPIYRADADSSAAKPTQLIYSDEYYATAYGIPMAAGEFYSKPGAFTDSSKVVINETQAKIFGWNNPQDAVGRQLKFLGSPFAATIAGVTKDFHFGSMQQAIQPVTFLHVGTSTTYRFLSFRLRPGNISGTIATLQKKWSSLMPGAPFEYRFMDETLKRMYRTEIQLKQASQTATLLAIIIVLLGVIGLVSLHIQRRVKEIGVRKVLGASIVSIISLFIKEFLWVILIGGAIGSPIAWLIMQGWLNDYVYRVSLTAIPFIISVGILAGITVLLIVLQTFRAGNASPVKSLRTE